MKRSEINKFSFPEFAYHLFINILTDKVVPEKVTEANRQVSIASDKGGKANDLNSGAYFASTYTSVPPTPKIQPPKSDATDRRQIEAHNEDKSHTTKEVLGDIKRKHYKEKQKKEEKNMEPGPSGITLVGKVRKH